MACKCAKFDTDNGRWDCSVSGDNCMYLIPNSKRCAEEWGEGPDVNSKQLCPNCKRYDDCPNPEYREPSGYCDDYAT
jgi:hypothetical protein